MTETAWQKPVQKTPCLTATWKQHQSYPTRTHLHKCQKQLCRNIWHEYFTVCVVLLVSQGILVWNRHEVSTSANEILSCRSSFPVNCSPLLLKPVLQDTHDHQHKTAGKIQTFQSSFPINFMFTELVNIKGTSATWYEKCTEIILWREQHTDRFPFSWQAENEPKTLAQFMKLNAV